MAIDKTYVGYYGFIQDNGSSRNFNITNLGNDEVTISFTENFNLTVGDDNTYVTIVDANGVTLVDHVLISLVEFGNTGEMADGNNYAYTIVTINGDEYIFLDAEPYPTQLIPNPFSSGHNPLDGNPGGGTHDVCFVNGTRIQTPTGDRPIEELVAGDLVVTRDSGVQKIVWAGARALCGLRARLIAPIRISAGALGKALPARDLLVSPQHRILLSDWRADLLFGVPEVLVAAKHLVNDLSIRAETGMEPFTYHHILFDKHETVFSEGLPTESFHPGDMAMCALGQKARAELLELFPELQTGGASGGTTHLSLKAYEAKALAFA